MQREPFIRGSQEEARKMKAGKREKERSKKNQKRKPRRAAR